MISSLIIHKPPRNFLSRLQKCAQVTSFYSYDEVVQSLINSKKLPDKGLVITFDHAYKELSGDFSKALSDLNIKPTLFIHTWPIQTKSKEMLAWDQIARLAEEGWNLGAHTHTHMAFTSDCDCEDYIEYELEHNDKLIRKYTGISPEHFAYPGGVLSDEFEKIIKARYKSACLWVASPEFSYNCSQTSWHKFLNLQSSDYYPLKSLYINNDTDRYRIPRVEMTELLAAEDLFWQYISQEKEQDFLPLSSCSNKGEKITLLELTLFGKRLIRISVPGKK